MVRVSKPDCGHMRVYRSPTADQGPITGLGTRSADIGDNGRGITFITARCARVRRPKRW